MSTTKHLHQLHYYPFGLTMAGISSKALSFGVPHNNEKTFQGQRLDDELGINYIQFKWRNHDPQIGRFIEIDPLAEKYVYNSTYAFSENKVIRHVELEGLEAIVSNIGDPKHQGDLVEIRISGKVINDSKTNYSPEQMQGIANSINQGINAAYTNSTEETNSVGRGNISVATSDNPLQPGEHAYRIVDPDKVPDPQRKVFVIGATGASDFGASVVYLSSAIVGRKPATSGQYEGTGKDSNGHATVERTGAHETGHSLTLEHPDDPSSVPGNLMNQTIRPEAGMKLTGQQILTIIEANARGELNNGVQRFY